MRSPRLPFELGQRVNRSKQVRNHKMNTRTILHPYSSRRKANNSTYYLFLLHQSLQELYNPLDKGESLQHTSFGPVHPFQFKFGKNSIVIKTFVELGE
jgi:hypothetical protein